MTDGTWFGILQFLVLSSYSHDLLIHLVFDLLMKVSCMNLEQQKHGGDSKSKRNPHVKYV